ncbi:uncharacterized protein LOC116289946 isoform X2 [Actinia tenebrosa]|uniref:Uncharacterized protein LOC116289946 isoform X2 n=1 Tax=Actinia tenebrosa TaxID=6105 RepID=A0A6P8HJI6_ACTTE|nr:uncharacterized protein LOC116289946 isoform X2 [Actinia tenebrosa]
MSSLIITDFCARRTNSTLCERYLEVRTTLNLSRILKDKEKSRSCFRMCSGFSRQGDSAFHYNCFCDELCGHYQDCCVDYHLWCKSSSEAVHTNFTCRFVHGEKRTGFLMIDTCPSTFKNAAVKTTLYKNVFCAFCNEARNLKYWKVEIPKNFVKNGGNQTLEEILAQTKKWKFINPDNYSKYLSYCKPQHPGCKNGTSLAHLLRMNKSELETICNSYSFPLEVCHRSISNGKIHRNLHCMLCDGIRIRYNDTMSCHDTEGGLISQTIAFDFVAHDSAGNPQDKETTRTIRYRCDAMSAYNPFTNKCHSLNGESTMNNRTNVSGQVIKKVQTTLLNSTCMEVSGNSSQNISVLSNGSLLINGKIREDIKLEVIDNSSYICWNNYTESYTSRGHPEKGPHKTVLGIITAVCFALSTTCLLYLLVTYTIFPELRTTPGKTVMSLSCALMLYMACHLPLTSTSYPVLCVGNAIVLHYAVLSVFAWLSVLAFDISKRFGGKAIERVAARADRSQSTARKRCDSLFFKYCAYSWGMPLAIISACIVLDVTDTFSFGYGQGLYCYISSHGIMAAVVAPVTAILLFNFTALVRTVYGINKLKKDTSIASQSSSQSSSGILYLKLTCLFGLSWILNIIFAFTQNIFVAYLAVILNSCQGIFMCLGFCFNERVLSFYKAKLGIVPKPTHSQASSKRSNTDSTSTRL